MHWITQGKSHAARVGMCTRASGCPAKRLKPSTWFHEPQAELGCVARRDGGREPDLPGSRGPAGDTKVIRLARNLSGSERNDTPRSRNEAD